MDWYHILTPEMEKWVTLAVLIITFAFILYRRFNIAYISLVAAALLILIGITNPAEAFFSSVNWDVLAIYWGYGMLAIAFRESKIPAWIANQVLVRVKKEKYALLFLCILAMVLSSFMPNPTVVLILAPLAFEMANRLNVSPFRYLVSLAISSNVVTTVSMVADPPALILASATGMDFLDFYWFHNRLGLGTLSMIGVVVALLTLLFQFRRLNNKVKLSPQPIRTTYGALVLLVLSVLALAFTPTSYSGIVGLTLGLLSLLLVRNKVREVLKGFDWASILFLIGIFIVIASVEHVGLLKDFSTWLMGLGITSAFTIFIIITWLSVALSSFIDNVPYTILMIPVCTYLAQALKVSPFAFYYGMLVGTGIGGNITPVGATANVLACGMLEKRGYKINLGRYMAISVPFSVSAVLVVQLLLQWLWL